MIRIVSLDTASEFGSLALVEDGVVVEEILLHSPEGFSQILFPQLDRLMRHHGWRHETVTAYAAGAGPGSFTGVRIALAALKGLAEASHTRCAAVSNLKALATFGTAPVRAPFYDARRGEIFGALFDDKLQPLTDETVSKFQTWQSTLPPEAELITYQPEIFGHPATAAPRALAGPIGQLATQELTDPITIDANYVRRSDAELNWTDR